MTRALGDVLELQTTSPQHESSRLSVPCPCALMRDGTRSSSISLTSQDERTAPTTLRHSGFRFTPTAASEGYISQTVSIQKRNFQPSLSFSCQCRNSSRFHPFSVLLPLLLCTSQRFTVVLLIFPGSSILFFAIGVRSDAGLFWGRRRRCQCE